MSNSYFFDPIRILYSSEKRVDNNAVLIVNREIKSFGQEARVQAKQLGLKKIFAKDLLLAPCLIDPHSILEDHLNGQAETLSSLKHKASSAGYGQIALLPKSSLYRDNPEYIQILNTLSEEVLIHFWGNFSRKGEGKELTSHYELIKQGAIGLADNDSIIPTDLLKKGLLLDEAKDKPILVAPKDNFIQANGVVREGVEALRSGWQQDPIASETIPLGILIELQKQHPNAKIRLMNLSTTEGVLMLAKSPSKPMATVCWWHLIADQSLISSTDIGIHVSPSLGNSADRFSLIEALRTQTLTGVSVHGISLDDAETKKPVSERTPGISGYHLVLPSLWKELIEKANWSIEELWEAISFGPSKILDLPSEELKLNSKRWLLYDPNKKWTQTNKFQGQGWRAASNEPFEGLEIKGKVLDCGLKN